MGFNCIRINYLHRIVYYKKLKKSYFLKIKF